MPGSRNSDPFGYWCFRVINCLGPYRNNVGVEVLVTLLTGGVAVAQYLPALLFSLPCAVVRFGYRGSRYEDPHWRPVVTLVTLGINLGFLLGSQFQPEEFKTSLILALVLLAVLVLFSLPQRIRYHNLRPGLMPLTVFYIGLLFAGTITLNMVSQPASGDTIAPPVSLTITPSAISSPPLAVLTPTALIPAAAPTQTPTPSPTSQPLTFISPSNTPVPKHESCSLSYPPAPVALPSSANVLNLYTVVEDDALSTIAETFGTSWWILVELNKGYYPWLIEFPGCIYPGQQLVVP